MPPRLVLCHCDLPFNKGRPVFAVCTECERRQLHDLLVRRNAVADPARQAFDALVASYHLEDAGDSTEGLDDFYKNGTHQ